MIEVEAGEVILRDEVYVLCKQCEYNRAMGRGILNEHCRDCHGWGLVPNPEYVEACKLLGLPVPMTQEEIAMQRLNLLEAKWDKVLLDADEIRRRVGD